MVRPLTKALTTNNTDNRDPVLALRQTGSEELQLAITISLPREGDPSRVRLLRRDRRVQIHAILRPDRHHAVDIRGRIDRHCRAGEIEGETRILLDCKWSRTISAQVDLLDLAECLQGVGPGTNVRLGEVCAGVSGLGVVVKNDSPLGADLGADDESVDIQI